MQDTGKYRTNTKDQFYTLRDLAAACVRHIHEHVPEAAAAYTWIEPSAGAGAFLASAPAGAIGIDIEPAGAGITTADFLTWEPPAGRPILIFGNPPFGRQSSLAKAFIAKSCRFADAIAFILPRSFVKPSMQRAFDAHFHCVYSEPVPVDAFTINGAPHNVPCVFQIWRRRAEPRPAPTAISPAGFTYVKADAPHNLIVRRVGAHAGRAHVPDGQTFSVQSHHFIALGGDVDPVAVAAALNEVEFPTNTTGPRSLSKSEINTALNAVLDMLTS
jgi:hypothetical protein